MVERKDALTNPDFSGLDYFEMCSVAFQELEEYLSQMESKPEEIVEIMKKLESIYETLKGLRSEMDSSEFLECWAEFQFELEEIERLLNTTNPDVADWLEQKMVGATRNLMDSLFRTPLTTEEMCEIFNGTEPKAQGRALDDITTMVNISDNIETIDAVIKLIEDVISATPNSTRSGDLQEELQFARGRKEALNAYESCTDHESGVDALFHIVEDERVSIQTRVQALYLIQDYAVTSSSVSRLEGILQRSELPAEIINTVEFVLEALMADIEASEESPS